jgi:hypothetical protein
MIWNQYTKHVNMSSLLLSKFSDSYIKGKLRAVSELEQVRSERQTTKTE